MEETPPNDNLESKIKKEIMKSGFPLELFIFERCGRKNVGRMSNLRYIQDKELKEIDILTSFEEICFEEGKNPQYTSSNMIIECKKGSDKPWVFFQLPSNRKPGGVLYNLVYDSTFNDFFAHDAKPELLGQIRKNLKNHHYRNNKIPICISYCEPFKKENQSQIYPAIISVISYLKHLRKRHEQINTMACHTNCYYPTIIFDGLLYTSWIKNDVVNLKPTDHLQYLAKTETGDYIIDVITKPYFDKFFDIIEKDHDELVSAINNINLPNNYITSALKYNDDFMVLTLN